MLLNTGNIVKFIISVDKLLNMGKIKKIIITVLVIVIILAVLSVVMENSKKKRMEGYNKSIQKDLSKEEAVEDKKEIAKGAAKLEEDRMEKEEKEKANDSLPSCGDKIEFFSVPPINYSELKQITPIGSVSPPHHIFPMGRLFIRTKIVDGKPIEAAMISPGDVWVTGMQYIEFENYPPDYTVFFSPCKELTFNYNHLASVSDKLLAEYEKAKIIDGTCKPNSLEETGRRNCAKNFLIKISAGEPIGTSMVRRGTVDFQVTDFRKQTYFPVNPNRWNNPGWLFTGCPLDYFTEEIRKKYMARVGMTPGGFTTREMEPLCGTMDVDIPGTAQGLWFAKGIEKTLPEDPHLALVPHHLFNKSGVFSMGNSIKGITSQVYGFTYQEGLVNTNFKDVKTGNIYCYETGNSLNEISVIILELTDEVNLRIEKVNLSNCGDGPWTFSEPAEFER